MQSQRLLFGLQLKEIDTLIENLKGWLKLLAKLVLI